jgi:hypothetical protein
LGEKYEKRKIKKGKSKRKRRKGKEKGKRKIRGKRVK